jgi:hypothetical protein
MSRVGLTGALVSGTKTGWAIGSRIGANIATLLTAGNQISLCSPHGYEYLGQLRTYQESIIGYFCHSRACV